MLVAGWLPFEWVCETELTGGVFIQEHSLDQHLWEAEEGSEWAEGMLNVTQEIGSPHSPSDLSHFGPEWLGLYPPASV